MAFTDSFLSDRGINSTVYVFRMVHGIHYLRYCDHEACAGQIGELLLSVAGKANRFDHCSAPFVSNEDSIAWQSLPTKIPFLPSIPEFAPSYTDCQSLPKPSGRSAVSRQPASRTENDAARRRSVSNLSGETREVTVTVGES